MSDEPGAYERSGEGNIATEGELRNKFATYDNVQDANPEKTEGMKEKIRRVEQEKLDILGSKDDDDSEKKEKGGLLQKLKPGSKKDKDKDKDAEGNDLARTTSKPPADPDSEHIALTHHESNPDAPTLVVKEQ